MPPTRRLGAVVAALLCSGLAVLSPVLTTSAVAAEILADGGFEATDTTWPYDSPSWTATDITSGGTPVCPPATCTTAVSGVEAHSGTAYVWFGGYADAGHTASISQVVTIPHGSAALRYWLANPQTSDSLDPARLDVTIDGKLLRRFTEGEVGSTYQPYQLDISEFADGAAHTLAFAYLNGDTGNNSMVLDDVSIDALAGATPILADPGSLGPIPDGSGGDCEGASGPSRDVTFTVRDKVGRPTDVGVRMAFDPEHTDVGDVVAVLIAPDGRRTTIFGPLDDLGNDSHLDGPYLFDDHAPWDPSFGEASVLSDGILQPGHYRASTSGNNQITPAFAEAGIANGTWTLRLRDRCDPESGSISAAALVLTTDGVPPSDTTPPDTSLTSSPAKGIAKSLRVPFVFTADEANVSFQCSLDAATYTWCANPVTLVVKPGRHTLAVRARDAAGNLDPYPATTRFTAYDCKSLEADVATLKKKVTARKLGIKKSKALLAAAVADGDDGRVRELRARLAKQVKKKAKLVNRLAKAISVAVPCKA